MKKDIFKKFTSEEQIEALKELNVAREEAKKERFSNFFRVSISIIFILSVFIILFRLFIGTIELNNPFGYEKNRFYEVTFNSQTVTVYASEHNRFAIIPWIVYFNSRTNNTYLGKKETMSEIEEAKQYILKVNSYSCYDENLKKRVKCEDKENHFKGVNKDTTYYLKIEKRTYNPATDLKDESWNVNYIYDGPFIEDVTKYIENGAEYRFLITSKYGTVTAEFDFYINYNRGY